MYTMLKNYITKEFCICILEKFPKNNVSFFEKLFSSQFLYNISMIKFKTKAQRILFYWLIIPLILGIVLSLSLGFVVSHKKLSDALYIMAIPGLVVILIAIFGRHKVNKKKISESATKAYMTTPNKKNITDEDRIGAQKTRVLYQFIWGISTAVYFTALALIFAYA